MGKIPRCEECDKAVFPTRAAARAHARKVWRAYRYRVRPYRAPCGRGWHLTKKGSGK